MTLPLQVSLSTIATQSRRPVKFLQQQLGAALAELRVAQLVDAEQIDAALIATILVKILSSAADRADLEDEVMTSIRLIGKLVPEFDRP